MENIIIYTPAPRSQRFKLFIPYGLTEERNWLKSQNSAFYYQKLWSLINTAENKNMVAVKFKGNYVIQTIENQPVKPKKIELNEKLIEVLSLCEQKFVLKSFSNSTIKTIWEPSQISFHFLELEILQR
jgi:integrase/recombinase XerD